MRKNSTDKILAEIERNKRSSLLIKALGIGAALCLAFGAGFAANSSTPAVGSASASVVETGFCVKSTGFDGEFTGDRSYNCGGESFKMLPPAVASTPACVLRPGSLGMDPRITMNWRVPAEMKGYTVKETEVGMVREGVMEPINRDLLGAVSTTGDPSSYSTTFTAKQLSGGLLGQRWTFGIRFVDPESGKTSPWLSGEAAMGNAGINATCTVGSIN